MSPSLLFLFTQIALIASSPAQTGQASAIRPPLTFGSPMPIPDIEQWPRGAAPDFKDPSKTFLISFWSSAITPARECLTQLSKFADEYRDQGLIVVAVTEEPAGGILPLLDSPKYKEGIRFAIGCDPDRSTYRQFMSESWQNTLPTAFLAQAGKIVWIGNPRNAQDVLAAVFAGKWTPEGRKEMYEQGAAATKRFMEFEKNLNILIDRRQWDAALEVITEMEKDPNKSLAREGRLLRVSILQQAGKTSEALELCDSLVAKTNDWEVASEVAKMLASPLFQKPDLARATIAALRGISLSKKQEALAYVALAEVQMRAGQRDLAINTFEKSLILAVSSEIDLIQDRLAEVRTPPSVQPPTSNPATP